MKSIKLSLVAALLATTAVVSNVSASDVEVSANVAMTTNYIWRGYSQTSNAPAIQGGFDLSYNGFYVGTWGSNVHTDVYANASSEIDIYAGYGGEIGKFSYDVGVLEFMYTGGTGSTENNNFAEAHLTLGYDLDVFAVSGTYYLGIDGTNDADSDTWEASVSVPLPMELSLDATYGDYMDYNTYYSVGLGKSFGKFDVSVMYAAAEFDGGGDEDNIVLTVGTGF